LPGVRDYLSRLEDLDPAGFELAPAMDRLVLLTGQSSFMSSALRAEQMDFLQAVAPPGARVCLLGFPWHHGLATPHDAPNLLAASWRNGQQWWWTRRRGRFTDLLSGIVARLRRHTAQRLLVVTGSCGIQLLAAALHGMDGPGPPISVFALGPVGAAPAPGCLAGLEVVQGSQDGWSRLLWRGAVDHRPRCGHLDYYRDAATREAARRFLAREAV